MIQARFPVATILCAALAAAPAARGQTIHFTSVPDGYTTGSIALPRPFGGALGRNPADETSIYASIGVFGDMNLARIGLKSHSVRIVAAGPFGALAGIAALSANQIVLIDNASAPGGPPDDTILLATDANGDGDFNDGGEIVELIAPILTGASWTGAQARVAPPGNPSKIPSGSVLIQTADGSGGAEILVLANPLTAPAFRPPGSAYFTGFDYNGGFDFDSRGRLIMGTLEGTGFTGQVFALVNTNADEDIDPGESNRVAAGENGMADLVVDAEDDVFFAGADSSFVASVRTFDVPDDPLTQTADPVNFATTDAGFLSAILLSPRTRPFEPRSGPNSAALIVSGWTAGFEPARNLLILRPEGGPAAASHWRRYE